MITTAHSSPDTASPADGPYRYTTGGGIEIARTIEDLPYETALPPLVQALDRKRGVVLSSSFEFPNRYTRWDVGFLNPPLEISAKADCLTVRALNARGICLIPAITKALKDCEASEALKTGGDFVSCRVTPDLRPLPEEERTRRRSLFSLLRALLALFHSEDDAHLGLYGAFGYDLTFQLEPLDLTIPRPDDQRDLLLYLPDELIVVDHMKQAAQRIAYDFLSTDFQRAEADTTALPRTGSDSPFRPAAPGLGTDLRRDHKPGEYPAAVEQVREAAYRGDLFECVLTQIFEKPCRLAPTEIFTRLKRSNPAPYGALMNLGDGEFLVAASPEMFVRVKGRRVETCPISGTIPRGKDALADAHQILTLLNSKKDESELTMCTDVDRNDKARVCTPGSVKVIGRRQIEAYSRLIHTVDHVEGELKPGMDALDAFLTHTWAVTVTGAPKRRAMEMIEATEKSSRRWYGGAIGALGFNGSLNTGLTLRTFRLKDGMAQARVGATLLYDSDPVAEDEECALKVSALLATLDEPKGNEPPSGQALPRALDKAIPESGRGKKVFLVDHHDSFVLTLADYFRQTGAEVITLRPEAALDQMKTLSPDLLVLSPGPGLPKDFPMTETIDLALSLKLPIFGVCLGLQGLTEYFGGRLDTLSEPMHGKPSAMRHRAKGVFENLPDGMTAARYHSIFAEETSLPACLEVTARARANDDPDSATVVMALAHKSLPIAATQFHPESILTQEGDLGLKLIDNAVRLLTAKQAVKA
ncbi:anthranilate synthase component I [Rhodovibrionaceae bacterium A322]